MWTSLLLIGILMMNSEATSPIVIRHHVPHGVKQLGDRCHPSGAPCRRLLVCGPGGRCNCAGGLEEDEGFCVPMRQALPGRPCVAGQLCLNGAVCGQGRCQCPMGEVLQTDHCEMQRPARVGQHCSKHQRCYNDAVCINGICACDADKRLDGGVCIPRPPVMPGEKCVGLVDRPCLNDAVCVDGVCRCQAGRENRDGFCMPIRAAEVGEKCDIEQRCKNGAFCLAGVMTSLSDYNPDYTERDYADKSFENFGTREGLSNFTCRCQPGTKLDGNGICQYTKPIKIGEACEASDLCMGGLSSCNNGKCVCAPGLTVVNGRCIGTVMPQFRSFDSLT